MRYSIGAGVILMSVMLSSCESGWNASANPDTFLHPHNDCHGNDSTPPRCNTSTHNSPHPRPQTPSHPRPFEQLPDCLLQLPG